MPSNSVTARISWTDRQNHANDGPFTKGLRKVLQKRLRAGRCPVEDEAAQYSMSRRTVTRYLEAEGLKFRDLANATTDKDVTAQPSKSRKAPEKAASKPTSRSSTKGKTATQKRAQPKAIADS